MNDYDFIKYLEDLKNLKEISPHEYENTKTEILNAFENVKSSVVKSNILVPLKKKILKNLEMIDVNIERMFTLFEESLKETEETFDKDLLIAKVDFSMQKIQEHYQIIKKLAQNA